VAQLGARLNGIQEVRGSTPLWSTKSKSLIPKDRNPEPRPAMEPRASHSPGLLPGRPHPSQFSTLSTGTRLNSATLSVTHTASRARACAAISMSCAPMGCPSSRAPLGQPRRPVRRQIPATESSTRLYMCYGETGRDRNASAAMWATSYAPSPAVLAESSGAPIPRSPCRLLRTRPPARSRANPCAPKASRARPAS
jgi:hypothetical protein